MKQPTQEGHNGQECIPHEEDAFQSPLPTVAEASKRWKVKASNWPESMDQLSSFSQDMLQTQHG
jgi:hypothetical protein